MIKPVILKFNYGNNTIILETGKIANQANSSVLINMDGTTVLITVVEKKNIFHQNFLPLTVNYQERSYAAGKIPGGFFKREGRPSENEILIARLIDRPIRPLFPKNYFNEIQIIATVVSLNPEINPDLVSLIGVSAALCISGIPFYGPIGAARVGYINNKYMLNPTVTEMKTSALDLVLSGNNKFILMVESESKELSEDIISNAIIFGHQHQKVVIENIKLFAQKVNHKIWNKNILSVNKSLYKRVKKNVYNFIDESYSICDRKLRDERLKLIKNNIIKNYIEEKYIEDALEIENIFYRIEKKIFRKKIFKNKLRLDNRKFNEIRKIDIKIGILDRVHGSSLFTRGDTQALVSITLGTERDAQNLDDLFGDRTDNFLFHYNFPPYSVGEIGIIGSPKRREIGHGKLAKKSIFSVMPKVKNFPYTVRVVSEITSSHGSSSMAAVCGASLALMDAGVPIKSAIAGVAMGLIKKKEKYKILSDISGDEDHFGDMDFKIAGSKKGITALQIDMKISGINMKVINLTLLKSKKSRLFILNKMNKIIKKSKSKLSKFAPKIHILKIDQHKIKDVIGKGGSVIRNLTEETGTTIEIEDSGIIKISSITSDKAKIAINRIKEITKEVEIGKIYFGTVTKIMDFGAFVSIGMGKEGLVHISQISNTRVNKVSDVLKLNQKINVKVLDIDKQKRLRLSIKETL
ncbi:polyribonucleotide nucleotidyltransferase [Buchnera aphidicola]|uniref:polyribonucleotide nucleotidyltransferase n=1 Tax=Buchnera aphidicola TaxID=9 RepID=UPI0030EBAEDB